VGWATYWCGPLTGSARYCISSSSCCGWRACCFWKRVARQVDRPWCRRASVVRSTPYLFAICVYTSFSPGSKASIAASAASIGSICGGRGVTKLMVVVVVVGGTERAFRRPARYRRLGAWQTSNYQPFLLIHVRCLPRLVQPHSIQYRYHTRIDPFPSCKRLEL
jgi:hypothetical protein